MKNKSAHSIKRKIKHDSFTTRMLNVGNSHSSGYHVSAETDETKHSKSPIIRFIVVCFFLQVIIAGGYCLHSYLTKGMPPVVPDKIAKNIKQKIATHKEPEKASPPNNTALTNTTPEAQPPASPPNTTTNDPLYGAALITAPATEHTTLPQTFANEPNNIVLSPQTPQPSITSPTTPQAHQEKETSTHTAQHVTQPETPTIPKTKLKTVYRVLSGDTFYGIARLYKCTPDQLKAANPKINPNKLIAGQKINIPSSSPLKPKETAAEIVANEKEHTVAKGETLSRIARKHKTSLQALLKANNMTEKDAGKIKIGQKIIIP